MSREKFVDNSSDRELDQMLAQGHTAGPELDRMWEKIAPQVKQTGKRDRRTTARRLSLLAIPIVAASALFFLWPRQTNIQGRGEDLQGPLLQATCGEVESPCRVGQPIFLKLWSSKFKGTVAVTLLSGQATRLLYGPAHLGDLTLPVQLKPETSDIKGGIALQLLYSPYVQLPGDTPPSLSQLQERSDLTLLNLQLRVAP